VKKVRAWIDDHFSRLRIVESSYCDVPLEILLSVGRFDPTQSDSDGQHFDCADPHCWDEHHNHDHSAVFTTWSYEANQPLSLEALREAARKLPGNVYRAKGVVYTSDAPDRRAVLQVVGRRVDISVREKWDGRVPRTQIVVIGAADSIDANLLEEIFASCISAAPAETVA
jgi:G3E family GTPase